jgi:hypothetical protein
LRLIQRGPRLVEADPDQSPELDAGAALADPAASESAGNREPEFGLVDLEAAVALIDSGLASRIVLTGFPSVPGLLWQAYRLADTAGVVILPIVVRPGGLVDIVIERDNPADG